MSGAQIRSALESNPTLTLLKAHSRDWVLPLFADHLEQVDGSVSADWFHEQVAQAREVTQGVVDPVDLCREWVDKRWLETETVEGRVRYRLSPHALRALRVVHDLVEGDTQVTGARFASISHAVQQLADMSNPDREAQARRLDEQIEALQHRRADIAAGKVRLATDDEMAQQLREILAMTRALPADFRELRTMVEDRHQQIARRALVDGPPKAELVEQYLRENDLLARTSQGTAYLGFTRQLSSQRADQLRADIDQILDQDFAREQMSTAQRDELDLTLSTLLAAELEVQTSYVRWSASLRRFLTRAAGARHQRMITLVDQALHAASEWVQADPGQRSVPSDLLGIGPLAATDLSQTQLWVDHGTPDVVVDVVDEHADLPDQDRESLRLSVGSSPRAIGRTVNDLLADRSLVTGADVFETVPPEFRRLGTLVSILDLAVAHGRIDDSATDTVMLAGNVEQALLATLPHVVFEQPITTRDED